MAACLDFEDNSKVSDDSSDSEFRKTSSDVEKIQSSDKGLSYLTGT